MPRKLRRAKARAQTEYIRPSVLAFLETGDLRAAEVDNEWLVISLLDPHAKAARAAWAAGDRAQAIDDLRRCAGSRSFFQPGRQTRPEDTLMKR